MKIATNEKTVKRINELLEIVVDEYAEILMCFKEVSSKKDALELFVSAKRRMIILCNKIAEIYNRLVELKYNK